MNRHVEFICSSCFFRCGSTVFALFARGGDEGRENSGTEGCYHPRTSKQIRGIADSNAQASCGKRVERGICYFCLT